MIFFITCTGSRDHLSRYGDISQMHTRDLPIVPSFCMGNSISNKDAIGKYLSKAMPEVQGMFL
jgi:hypothetical protein